MAGLDIDIQGAAAALEAHDAQAAETEQAVTPPALPVEGQPPAAEVEAPAPAEGGQAPEETPDFTSIDDSVLSPELLAIKRSMQADYTRKTQEAAPWRKMADEFGVESPDEVRDAMALYQRISDPSSWPQLHSELSQYLEANGVAPAQAQQQASEQLADFAIQAQGVEPEAFDEDDDPRLAALAKQVQEQNNAMHQLVTHLQTQQQTSELQRQAEALGEHLTKQELAIRQQNPHYGDDDIAAIYNLMSEDANLTAAQQKYDSLVGAAVARYIGGKQTVANSQPAPIPGGGIVATETQERPRTLADGHKAAMEYVRQLERQEAQAGL